MEIQRKTLSAQVREVLLARIREGNVPWGESINEVKLSAELGVSRTPLREALTSLASAGYIESVQGLGFSYPEMNISELREIAPVIAELEALALRLTPLAEIPRLGKELLRVAKAFVNDSEVHDRLMKADDEWHHLMISQCPNGFLINEIESIRQTLHRYESLLVPSTASVKRVADEHQRIAKAMIDKDLSEAETALHANWANGVSRLIESAKQ